MAPLISCGIIPFDDSVGELRVLVLRAYRYWDFPKGLTEPGESPRETALRECAEETGIRAVTLPWGDAFYETPTYGRGASQKRARYLVGRVDPATAARDIVLPVSPELGRPEHHEARWVTPVAASELLNERVGAALAWALERRLLVGGPSAD